MRSGAFKCLLSVAVIAFLPASAAAQEIEVLGTFGDWEAVAYTVSEAKSCYLTSVPKKAEGKYKKRGEIYARVTHRPAGHEVGVVSITTGYNYREGSEVEVKIGGHQFTLYTHPATPDTAWAYDEEERALIRAMIQGKTMVVRGTSWRGTLTEDTYSLTGFTAGYKAIGKACGVS